MSRSAGPAKCIEDVFVRLEEKRSILVDGLDAEYESSSRWLAEAIKTCKRKILASSGLDKEPKKIKVSSTVVGGKENGNPNGVGNDDDPSLAKSSMKQDAKVVVEDDDDIDVSAMKVAELRAELRSRGLDATGLKKDLQKRLAEAIEAGRIERKDKFDTDAAEEEELGRTNGQPDSTASASQNNVEAEGQEVAITSAGGDAMEIEAKKDECKNVERNSSGSAAMVTSDEQSISACAQDIEMMEDDGAEEKVLSKEAQRVRVTDDVVKAHNVGPGQVEESDSAPQTLDAAFVKTSDPSHDKPLPASQPTESQKSDLSDLASPRSKVKFGGKLLKATSKLFSPSKKNRSPVKATKSPGKQRVKESEVATSSRAAGMKDSASTQETLDASTKDSTQSAAKALKSSLKTPALSKIASQKTSSGDSKSSASSTASSSSKSVQAKTRALQEARKARLAEIRGKSKPVPLSQATRDKFATADLSALKKTSASSTHSSALKSTSSSLKRAQTQTSSNSGGSAEEKRKILAAQIREKAAAAKRQAEAGSKPAPSSSQQQQPSRSAYSKQPQHYSSKGQAYQPQQAKAQSPAAKHQQQFSSQAAKKHMNHPQHAKALSPMDTYEISDREDSDSDESDYDEEPSKKKKIPKWAQKSNLIPALERQFADGPDRSDPDAIFKEVQTCDLEAIFDQKKSRYQRRTSSGNWTRDRVTVAEKLTYKRTMGYAK